MTLGKDCEHPNPVHLPALDRGFTGPVARSEKWVKRSAHGWLTITEQCPDCGRRRDANVNRGVEYGPWYTPGTRPAERRAAALDKARTQCLAAYAGQRRLPTAHMLPDMRVVVEQRGRRFVAVLDDAYLLQADGSAAKQVVIGAGDTELAALCAGRANAGRVLALIGTPAMRTE